MAKQMNEKWILWEDLKPALKYRSVYEDAAEGEIAEEEESDRVLVLSADGEIGIGFYNEYKVKGVDEIRTVIPGCWLRTEKTEYGVTNTRLEETNLQDVYAWQPLPEIFEEQ